MLSFFSINKSISFFTITYRNPLGLYREFVIRWGGLATIRREEMSLWRLLFSDELAEFL